MLSTVIGRQIVAASMSSPEARHDASLEVAVARVGRSGGRARWAAIAWGAALVALVAIAIGDRAPEAGAPRVAVALPAPGRHADPGPTPAAIVRRAPVVHATAPRERTPGEDGLMGSLVFFEPEYRFVLWWPVGNLPG